MPWHPQLTVLRNRLAVLFPTQEDARLLVDDAQLDASHVGFDNKAINNWHSILGQAELRGKVEALVLAAIGHTGPDAELVAAYQAYMTSVGKTAQTIDMSQSITPPAKSNAGKYNITVNNPQGLVIGDNAQVTQNFGPQVNTGGGTYVAGDVETGGDFVGRDKQTGTGVQPKQDDKEIKSGAHELLAQHQRNLLKLQQKKAIYAAGEEPLSLLNQIEHEEQEIANVKSQLGQS